MNRLMQSMVVVFSIICTFSTYGMFRLSPQFVAAEKLFYSTRGILNDCLLLNKYIRKYQNSASVQRLKKMNDQLKVVHEKINDISELGIKGFERAYYDAQHGVISDVTLLKVAELEYQVLKDLCLSSYVSVLPRSAFKAWYSLEGKIEKLQKSTIRE